MSQRTLQYSAISASVTVECKINLFETACFKDGFGEFHFRDKRTDTVELTYIRGPGQVTVFDAFAVSRDVIFILSDDGDYFVLLRGSSGWFTSHILEDYPSTNWNDKKVFYNMKANIPPAESFLDPPKGPNAPKSSLALVRANKNFDFKIMAEDGSSVPVHSLIFESVWPFFKTMLESNMSESAEKKMQTPYPLSWIEAMVSHLYEEDNELSFDDAIGLVGVASMYVIPKLEQLAINRIHEETLDVPKSLAGWRLAHQDAREELQEHFSCYLRRNLDMLGDHEELLVELTKEEVVRLMLAVSRTSKPRISS